MGTSTFATETAAIQTLLGDQSATTLSALQQFGAEAYDEVGAANDWPWLWYEGRLNLVAPYTTGTLSGSAGGTTLTGSGTTWTGQGFTNNLAEVQVGNERYLVTITANTTLTLSDSGTLPAAIAAGTGYTLLQRKYALAARMRGTPIFTLGNPSSPAPLRVCKQEELAQQEWPPLVGDAPDRVALSGYDSSGNTVITLSCYPTAAGSLYYKGFRQPADISGSTAFDFPKEVLHAFRWLFRAKAWHWKRNLAMEQSARAQYEVTLARAIAVSPQDDGRSDAINLDPSVYFDPRSNGWREDPPRAGYHYEL